MNFQSFSATKIGLDLCRYGGMAPLAPPLQGAMLGHQPLDRHTIEAELRSMPKGKTGQIEPAFSQPFGTHLDSAKVRLREAFYDNNDGAVYVGMHAWTIDILLQLLFVETKKHCRGGMIWR